MSHGIKVGKDIALFARDEAWHRLGFVDPRNGIPIEEAMSMEYEGKKLDYPIGKYQGFVKIQNDDGTERELPVEDHWFTVREDTMEVLGRVSKDYPIITNRQVVETMKAVVKEADLLVAAALTLDGGRRFCLCLKLPEHIDIAGMESERTEVFIQATTTHGQTYTGGGMEGFRMWPTYTRGVCDNTVTGSLFRALGQNLVAVIRHSGSVDDQIQAARDTMHLSISATKVYQETCERLLDMRVTDRKEEQFVKALLPYPRLRKRTPERAAKVKAQIDRQRTRITESITETPDLKKVRHTGYGLLQGVAQWERHTRRYTKQGDVSRDEALFTRVMGHKGSNLTDRAGGILVEALDTGKFRGGSVAEENLLSLLADAPALV